jgi:holo-[acyl-carrier protein] synthase
MILGVGIDLVEVPRIRESLDRHGEAFLKRVFGRDEVDYCLKMKDPAPHLAGRFAAKEAFAKALGTGIGAAAGWREIQVVLTESGKPELQLSGAAAASAAARQVGKVHLSLSHTGEAATAVVILEV